MKIARMVWCRINPHSNNLTAPSQFTSPSNFIILFPLRAKCQCCRHYQQVTQQHCVERPIVNEALWFYNLMGEIDLRQNYENCYHERADNTCVLRGYNAEIDVSRGDWIEMILEWFPRELCIMWRSGHDQSWCCSSVGEWSWRWGSSFFSADLCCILFTDILIIIIIIMP